MAVLFALNGHDAVRIRVTNDVHPNVIAQFSTWSGLTLPCGCTLAYARFGMEFDDNRDASLALSALYNVPASLDETTQAFDTGLTVSPYKVERTGVGAYSLAGVPFTTFDVVISPLGTTDSLILLDAAMAY